MMKQLIRAWFLLTHDEQKAVSLILGLLLLGLLARFWFGPDPAVARRAQEALREPRETCADSPASPRIPDDAAPPGTARTREH